MIFKKLCISYDHFLYIFNSLKDHSVENLIRSSGGLGLEYQSLDRGIIDTVSKICDILSLSF